jgi:hypothetical protein
MRQNFCNCFRKFRPFISAVDEQRLQKWKHAEQCRHDESAAIAILDIGRMNNGVEQQAYCVDKNVPLLALDLLARIVPVRINARPPYMGRLKSSANFMVLPFFVPFVLAIGGDRPTPIDPHESGGGGRSLDLKTTKRHEAEPASS